MSTFNLLNFTYEEAPFCCGLQVVGDFRERGTVATYEEAVKNAQQRLRDIESSVDSDDYDDDDEDRPPSDGCYALIATVPTEWHYRHKLLLDAGMVEVKRWVNRNSGNELALLVSPDEWPPLK